MDETVRRHRTDDEVRALVGRWQAATGSFSYARCGHATACVATIDGNLELLDGEDHKPLGRGKLGRTFTASKRALSSGERLILVTDGITERTTESGVFGLDGIRSALAELETPTAAGTAMAILNAVTSCWQEPLEDDGTVVVLAID
jgi:serine phosphatase RsbU (regulator of sigma subunit)